MKISEISENISHTSKRLRDIEREKKVKPGTDDWFKLWFSLPYLKEAKENIYDILEPEDCGPFDGGCVLVAQALQQIHGGDIVVLINDRGNADHAAVKLGNTLIDYDGPLPVEKFIKRFEKNEHVKIKGIRLMKDSDLPEATRNQSLLPKIVNLLSNGVKEALAVEPDVAGYQHTALSNPQYTIMVNTPGELDWYKIGQHFATLGQQDPHEWGQPESDMMIVAPNKEQLVRYMKELDRLGATYKLIGGSHEHPEVHDPVKESNPFTDARMNAIKAGKKEFTVKGKKYKVTGDTSDELEAVAREGLAEESGKEMLKIFRNMHHDTAMNKDMDKYVLSHNWELRNFTPDMFPTEEEFFDYDDPFDRIIDIDYSHRVNLSAPIIVGPQFSDGKYSVIDGNHRAAAAQRMGKTIQAYFPVKKTNEARSFTPQVTPLQSLINEYLFFSSFGTMEAPGDAKSPDSKAKLNAVITKLHQSNKSLQSLDKQKLEANRDKILNHIHDMMKYAIAHLREHLPPEKFDEKKNQINSVLTKYNAAASTKENFSESKLTYSTPNFEHEWEEAERYPEFRKIGKKAWIELVGKGKAVTIRSAKDINNTDAAEPDSFKSLDKTKQGRVLDQLKSGAVEMPIVALYPDGYKELVGGNTRLTAMLAQNGKATVWAFKVPDEVAELAENFADGKKKIQEVFTNPYAINWLSLQKTGESYAEVELPDGSLLEIRFTELDDGDYDIEFVRNRKIQATGGGDEFRIFATVVKAIEQWWNQMNKDEVFQIMFGASKSDGKEDSKRRNVLYKRFANQFAQKIGWIATTRETNRAIEFSIIRPEDAAALTKENFADGKKPGRKGLAKRMGVNTKASVSSLRKTAKNSSGEKQRMAHWLANMKAGREK